MQSDLNGRRVKVCYFQSVRGILEVDTAGMVWQDGWLVCLNTEGVEVARLNTRYVTSIQWE
jgi:hypothetical protein